jgi:hypothetical protein
VSGLDRIDDYVSGLLSDVDADYLEEELFAAPDDPDLAMVDGFARLAAYLVPRGTYDMGMTRAQVDTLEQAGRRVQFIDVGPPGAVSIRLRRDAEMIVIRYDVQLHGVDRIDVELTVPSHGISKTMRDVRVDPADGAIYGACEAALAFTAFGHGPVVTGGTVERNGRRESISYTIDATIDG